MLNQSQWCRHLHCNFEIVRLIEAQPEIGYDKPGIYEIVSVGRCAVRKMRNVRSIPQCEVPPGHGGCRKFAPPAPPAPGESIFEYNPAARLWMRYLGPIGDPEAEAEAARIEARKKEKDYAH